MRGLPVTAGQAFRTFFSHASPLMLAVLLVGALATRIVLGGWTWWDLLVPGVLVAIWPVYEWIIHVAVLHFRPFRIGGATIDMKVAKIHRYHHKEPWDLPIVFIPLHIFFWATIPLAVVALVLPAGWWGYYFGGLATYFALSLHYEWCHYLAHIDWCPPIRFYKRRVVKHRLHHFHHERMWWGVSTGVADVALRTDRDPKDVPHSATTHDLLASGHWWRRGKERPSDG